MSSDDMRPSMSFLLMARYSGRPIIPLDLVVRDFFTHLTVEKLLRKILRGDIRLAVVRMERSQKSARGVALVDLADYLDRQHALALKESEQLARGV